MITDQTNKVVWRWDNQYPFGANVPDEDPDGDGIKFTCNLRFPGQYFDKETNLAYNYFRDYDPSIGRYIQSDPIGLWAGLNTYGYAYGDPAIYFDPDALFCLSHNQIKLIAATLGGTTTGAIVSKNWGGAILGAVIGFGSEYVAQQFQLTNSAPGLSAVGAVSGTLAAGGGRPSLVGFVAGGFVGLVQSQSPGDFRNTIAGGFGGFLGTFAGQLAIPTRPYSWTGAPLFGAVKGGFAGIAGGYVQDVTEASLRKFECREGSGCAK